jgi:hypothetical protein
MQCRMDAFEPKRVPQGMPGIGWALLLVPVVVYFGGVCMVEPRDMIAAERAANARMLVTAEDPPREINPPPPPLPGTTTGLEKEEGSTSSLKRLARRAVEHEKSMNNYMCRIRRREQVNGKDQPEEIIMLKYCRAPLSIHCKWLGDEARGREIVYVQGQRDNRVSILTGKGDILGSGKQMTFPIESPIVRSKSRYPLTEAGIGAAVVRFGALMDVIDRGQSNAGSLRYLGLQSRSEFSRPVEAVEQTIPANLESFLPRGGLRYFFFDETNGLPMLVVTFDDAKRQVEYYHFDRLQSPVNLDENDFDPDILWKK